MDDLNAYLVRKNIELKKQLKEVNEKHSLALQKQIKSEFFEYEASIVLEENLQKAILEVEETLKESKKFMRILREIRNKRPLQEKVNK